MEVKIESHSIIQVTAYASELFESIQKTAGSTHFFPYS